MERNFPEFWEQNPGFPFSHLAATLLKPFSVNTFGKKEKGEVEERKRKGGKGKRVQGCKGRGEREQSEEGKGFRGKGERRRVSGRREKTEKGKAFEGNGKRRVKGKH